MPTSPSPNILFVALMDLPNVRMEKQIMAFAQYKKDNRHQSSVII